MRAYKQLAYVVIVSVGVEYAARAYIVLGYVLMAYVPIAYIVMACIVCHEAFRPIQLQPI